MIRAAVLLGVGAAAGVWASHRVRQRVRALTPVGLADTLADSVDRARVDARDFFDDVRRAADVRERELLAALTAGRQPEPAAGLSAARQPEPADDRRRPGSDRRGPTRNGPGRRRESGTIA